MSDTKTFYRKTHEGPCEPWHDANCFEEVQAEWYCRAKDLWKGERQCTPDEYRSDSWHADCHWAVKP